MKKDENIEKMLDELSDAQDAPKPELLLPAIKELRRQNSKQTGGAGYILRGGQPAVTSAGAAVIIKKKRVGIKIVALVIVIAVTTAIVVPQILKAVTNARTFALNALEISDYVTTSQKELFPVLNHSTGDQVRAEYNVLSQKGNTVAVQYKTRRLTKYAIEDIIIIAETGKFFIAEYQSYTKNTTYRRDGQKYCYGNYYEGGEYCAEYYVSAGDVRYYVNIISPKETHDSYYIDKIFEIIYKYLDKFSLSVVI